MIAQSKHPETLALHAGPRSDYATGAVVVPIFQLLDDSEQYLRAREAEAMCDHVWIFDGQRIRLWLRFRLPCLGLWLAPQARALKTLRLTSAASRREVMVPSASFASRRSTSTWLSK
jgi:hypothetical protein